MTFYITSALLDGLYLRSFVFLECHSKEKADARLIITKLNVTFFEKDNGSSWYALVHWNPLGKQKV